ncbi:MAG: cyclic-di-AMP receptor [Chloroflexota bacterium]|nr:cyclic-di-AMP receptor [Chloroflexota bacterium]
MKLVIAVISSKDTEALLDALNREEIGATLVQSKGGFLREGNATVFIGVDEDRLNRLFSLLSQTCRTRTRLMSPSIPAIESGEYLPTGPVEVEVGGATVFVLPVERYERI